MTEHHQRSAATTGLPFQKRVVEWLMACFSMEVCRDGVERNHRFLEEALELVQSLGCTPSEAHQLVDYVFNRPVGEPFQELGGSLVTLTALANCHDMDMMEAGETELARVWTKIDKIRAKQAAKPKHSPLPEHVPGVAQPAPRRPSIQFDVEAYVDSYEFRDQGLEHTPTEAERELLTDAIHGVIFEINESFPHLPGCPSGDFGPCDCAAQPPAVPVEKSAASLQPSQHAETLPKREPAVDAADTRCSAVSEPATVDEVLQAARLCLRSNRCLDADRFIARAQAALASAPPQEAVMRRLIELADHLRAAQCTYLADRTQEHGAAVGAAAEEYDDARAALALSRPERPSPASPDASVHVQPPRE